MRWRLGVDVGGTFTDFLLADEDGNAQIHKTSSTPQDPSIGLMNGLAELADLKGLGLLDFVSQIELIVHGTTVATNAVLTETGATTGLLTTEGFRDALEMRRGIREELYNNKYTAPRPLVPRRLRLPVRERIDYAGQAVVPLHKDSVYEAARAFRKQGVQAVAICFMHAYANSEHEQVAAEILTQEMPGAYLSPSSQLLPQVRFYDRVSTAVLNSYVGPILSSYLASLTEKLAGAQFRGVLLVMQSNGGVTSPGVVAKSPVNTLLSGPAAGPIAGVFYSSAQGYDDCITADMGGTSFDAALVKNRAPLVVTDGQINRRLIALPTLAIHTIGAGGGSIGWVDDGGLLRMGPRSAGASPGPVCYGRGGELPTCTDADLLLGYLNKDYFLGGRMRLDYDRAARAIEEHIARPLGLDVVEAAAGMYRLINVNMASGIREVSVKRGFDPRDFPLVVAGGAGPIHAAMIASELEMPLIIVPRESSIFCAAGMLLSDLKHDFVRTYHSALDEVDADRFRELFDEMAEEGERTLRAEKVPSERVSFQRSCDVRYVGQYHEVNVPVEGHEARQADTASILRRFHAAHDRLYGYSLPDTPAELVNLRLSALGRTQKPRFREQGYCGEDSSGALKGRRMVYLPSAKRFAEVDVYDGERLGHGNRIVGPAIVEQLTTTVFVSPEYNVMCDRLGSYTLYLKAKAAEYETRIKEATNPGRRL